MAGLAGLDVKYDSLTWILEKIVIEPVVNQILLRDRLPVVLLAP